MTSAMVLIGLLVALVGLVGLGRGRIVRLRVRNRAGAAARRGRRHGPRPRGGRVLALRTGRAGIRPRRYRCVPHPFRVREPARALGDDADPAPRCRLPSQGRGRPRRRPARGRGRPPRRPPRRRPGRRPRPRRTAAALAGHPAVKGRAPRTGYDREQFGQAWADADRNGCDTRNDVLRRDLTPSCSEPAPTAASSSAARSTTPTPARRSPSSAAQATSARRADRPRGRALRRLAEGRPAVVARRPRTPVRQRPAQPAGRRRPDQPGARATATPPPGCRRARPTAAPTSRDRPR